MLHIGQQLLQIVMPLTALPGRQGRAALEHVVVGVYAQSYQAAFASEGFHEPVGNDIIVGIDYDGPDPIDVKLYRGETAGMEGHDGTHEDFGNLT
jgi:hypothetical protein